jgi:fructan beta-fructosidase
MNNWQYANDVPTHPWRGQMSIPRSIALKKFSEGLRLVQSPVAELKMLRAEHEHRRDDMPIEVAKPVKTRLDGDCLEIIAEFEPKDATEFGLRVRKGGREETIIGYEVRSNQLFVDRSASGKVDFHADFSGKHIAPLSLENGRIKLHIYVDRCSVEVFANEGRAVLTDLIFPSPESNGLEVYVKGGSAKLISMDVWRLKSAWPEKR